MISTSAGVGGWRTADRRIEEDLQLILLALVVEWSPAAHFQKAEAGSSRRQFRSPLSRRAFALNLGDGPSVQDR